MPGIMVTNGGPHPPEKWAVMTGEHIFPIDPQVEGNRLVAAKKIQIRIIEALEPHHANAATTERDVLKAKGDHHLDTPLKPEDDAARAMAAVCAVLKGTPWESKANDPEWRRIALGEINSHFATVQHIERQWHAQTNKTPKAQAWLANIHPEA